MGNRCSCAEPTTQPPCQLDLTFAPSVRACVRELRERGVPLLAFGQTVLWDEPMKAVACVALHKLAPELRLVAAVHDADYFSKLTHGPSKQGFAILPHDQGATRDIWAAIAEISTLFGAELPLERDAFVEAGVPLKHLAAWDDRSEDAFYEQFTSAYGWRGLVYWAERDMVACEVAAEDVVEPLRELIEWAFSDTSERLAEGDGRIRVQALKEEVMSRLEEEAARDDVRTLSELYKRLLSAFYGWLVGGSCPNLTVTSSCEYFAFTAETCQRPHFDVLARFLDPQASEFCRRAYDEAVRGSGTYTLDQFGPGAIPFDVVVPGRGRGTIRVDGHRARVALPEGPVSCPLGRPIRTTSDLAGALNGALGTDISLVGKAVVNPLMLCSEGSMLLHEKASLYIPRSQRLAAALTERGLGANLHPIVRLRYETWDAFAVVDAELRLPRHLSRAFGRERVTAAEFAAAWRHAMSDAEAFLARIAECVGPTAAIPRLAERGYLPDGWGERLRAARTQRRRSGERIAGVRARQQKRLADIRRVRSEIVASQHKLRQLHRGQGDGGRERQKHRLEELRRELRERSAEYDRHKRRLLALADSDGHRRIQEQYRRLKHATAILRLEAVADALRVHALEHTNLRPSWWWFPALDESGAWFASVMATAEMRLEEWT